MVLLLASFFWNKTSKHLTKVAKFSFTLRLKTYDLKDILQMFFKAFNFIKEWHQYKCEYSKNLSAVFLIEHLWWLLLYTLFMPRTFFIVSNAASECINYNHQTSSSQLWQNSHFRITAFSYKLYFFIFHT